MPRTWGHTNARRTAPARLCECKNAGTCDGGSITAIDTDQASLQHRNRRRCTPGATPCPRICCGMAHNVRSEQPVHTLLHNSTAQARSRFASALACTLPHRYRGSTPPTRARTATKKHQSRRPTNVPPPPRQPGRTFPAAVHSVTALLLVPLFLICALQPALSPFQLARAPCRQRQVCALVMRAHVRRHTPVLAALTPPAPSSRLLCVCSATAAAAWLGA